MPTPLETAQAAYAALKKQQSDLWDKLHAFEATWRSISDERLKLEQDAHELQEAHLESIGMPPGKPPPAFMKALAEAVGADACNIEHIRARGNSSQYDRPIAQKIYDKAREAVPEIPEVAEMQKKADEMRERAERIEKEGRASAEYRKLRDDINALGWPLRTAQEEVERCRKNEEAKERRQELKSDPGLKNLKATREKLNAIFDGTTPFTWKPQ